MGNSHSAASNKSGTAASSPSAAQTATPTTPGLHHHHHHDSAARPHRKEPRNIIPPHTTHRSAAPPEASLAQAQGSTVVSWPKSLPSTAVSSLSGSPHSNFSTPAKPSDARAARERPTKPVDVPTESSSLRSHHHQGSHPYSREAPPSESQLVSNNSVTDMYLRGPPRLPLPIEEEVHTPGSPILAPEEGFGHVELAGESSDGLTRKSSALSANTFDDEESEELRVDKTRPVVPTRLEWKRGGDKIYVTGTIFQWNRKQRLHAVEGKPGCFAATIHILPGTHHVRFLVDGVMQTSPDLPTTVDFGNNLVNYIEVNPDDLPLAQKQGGSASRPEGEAEGVSRSSSQSKDQPRQPRGRPVDPPTSYQNAIPQYLLDFDQPEESPAYRNAVAAEAADAPEPAGLPWQAHSQRGDAHEG
ncbi:hypothetical protein OCS_06231 [Ophiocordyceps sinensis CO18]|uniref:AMP-activated protein kinase glycogen-binding domain-containing protein n=1 Tax=Ophiocordyceps sinensis (strain Co18 / CGMCC 3.14243) TaxID=911162 RepID=T5A8A3_OPHSC|nr:hypothetical protein OCS_06231 [Ophiocordyceps sinensis CO18]